ncbi:MAG: lamin tail domain-containing protein [Phycisphaerae bacterium]
MKLFAFGILTLSFLACASFGAVVITQTGGDTAVRELGSSDSFTVRLDTIPANDVNITVSPNSEDLKLGGGFPGESLTLAFTDENWNIAQSVSVSAADDGIEESTEQCAVSFAVSSSDYAYDNIVVTDLMVTVYDIFMKFFPAGDIDYDGTVSMADCVILAEQWLSVLNCSGAGCADLTGNGSVDLEDFTLISSTWQKTFGPVIINEFMADNGSDFPDISPDAWEVFDETGENVDWIELANISDAAVSLDGWYMSNDPNDMMKWQFPAGITIGAGEYMLFYASGNDYVSGEYIHTNFSLDNDGGALLLVRPDMEIASDFSEYEYSGGKFGYPPQQTNVSYGRTDYLTACNYFSPPSPAAANSENYAGLSPDTKFSVDRGFFTEPFELAITCDSPDALIRYTLNGSTPDLVNGKTWEPGMTFKVSWTTVVRARTYLSGHIPGNVDTQTYIFPGDVGRQQPDGSKPGVRWPDPGYSVNGQRIDYGMDPDIVNSSAYGHQIEDALTAIPSLCISTDLPNLFDPHTGIYVNAADARSDNDFWTVEKEKPCSLELIYPDGTDGFQIDCGLGIRGGYSRQDGNPKHAFRLFFRSRYGKGKLKYPMFGDEGTDKFDKLDLRTSQNCSWAFNDSGNNFHNTFIRDVFSRDTMGELGEPYTRSRYYHLYINRIYWGLYQTEERPDARFASSYLEDESDNFDVIRTDNAYGLQMMANDGNMDAFTRLWRYATGGMYSTETYMAMQGKDVDGNDDPEGEKLLDVKNLIDYQLLNYYTADNDGAASRFVGHPNNTYCIYNRVNPDGFKFIEHDSEHTMGYSGNGWPNYEQIVTPFTTAGSNLVYFGPHWLHEQLITQNEEYRMDFADRVQELFYNGGAFTCDKVWERVMSRAEEIDSAIIAESARWGDAVTHPARNRETWLLAIRHMQDFIYGTSTANFPVSQPWSMIPRDKRVIAQFDAVNWLPKTAAPELSAYGGYVPNGYQLEMTAGSAGDQIYFTDDGADPRLRTGISSTVESVTFIDESTEKKVFVPTEELTGTARYNSLLADYWEELAGWAVSSLTSYSGYPNNPTKRAVWQDFEMYDRNSTDNYGLQLSGWLYPPVTGDYRFYIAANDTAELLLSTDENPDNDQSIANVPSATGYHYWTTYTSQHSDLISLEASRRYHIRSLMKESTGDDHLSVAWVMPDSTKVEVIKGEYLLPGGYAWTTPGFDDSQWTSGTGAVVYERSTVGDYLPYLDGGIDVEDIMYGKNTTCYVRIPFEHDGSIVSGLRLTLNYEDGFVAYLNGVEVARSNCSGLPAWNSASSAVRADSSAVQDATFDISSYAGLLMAGKNYLSVHALNVSLASSDFLMNVKLYGQKPTAGQQSDSAQLYSSPLTLTKSTRIKTRAFDAPDWSAIEDVTFAVGDLASALRISEIMYHPVNPEHEYIELRNISAEDINLNLARFSKGIDCDFGDITIPAGDFLILARNSEMFRQYYAGLNIDVPVLQWTAGSLDNSGEQIKLVDALGGIIADFDYDDGWYSATDGDGFSLTAVNITEADPKLWSSKDMWRPSAYSFGSPGFDDTGFIPAVGSVVINELLSHSHSLAPDWIELYNTTDEPINIGGWFLSDSDASDLEMKKYQIPYGTIIAAHGYAVFTENEHFGNASAEGCNETFALSEGGETLFLRSGAGGTITGYQESESFGAADSNVSFGRYYKESTGTWNFVAMAAQTAGAANSAPLVGPIVISEIMYNPPLGPGYDNDEFEYIELANISSSSVNLWEYDDLLRVNTGWRITSGVDFDFAYGDSIPAGGKILLVGNIEAFKAMYPAVDDSIIFGPWSGKLDNGGERVEISKPGDEELGERYYIRIDRVNYDDEDLWPVEADGNGLSLERISLPLYGNDPANWQAVAGTPGV